MLNQVFVDCMPGPTHHYGGHAIGNLNSTKYKNHCSFPKKSALEWLEKVNMVRQLGAHQCILPPHPRPLLCHISTSKLEHLSSGFMWMANAGHFLPGIDSTQNISQFLPSNMNQSLHRNKEHYFNSYWIKQMIPSVRCHAPISPNDEGAANSIRLWGKLDGSSLNLFVSGNSKKKGFESRQNLNSLNEIIKKISPKNYYFLTQNQRAVAHGVFHNDVISFGFSNILFCHEYAFANQAVTLKTIESLFHKITKYKLNIIEIKNKDLSLDEAVESYLFNSQVILSNNTLICPSSVTSNKRALNIVSKWVSNGIFTSAKFVNINSSLMNGGGPACLRLALFLSDKELSDIPPVFLLTNERYNILKNIINTTYPDTFSESKLNAQDSRTIAKKISEQWK